MEALYGMHDEAVGSRSARLSKDRILGGVGMSILAHVMVVLLVVFIPWMMPAREVEPPLCTVSLLTLADLGGGQPEGEEGLMGKGGGELKPASDAEPPENEAVAEPEPEKPEVVASIPIPVPVKPVVEKPKPKPKPKPPPQPVRTQPAIHREEPPQTSAPQAGSGTTTGEPLAQRSGDGSGEGLGKGSGGSGPGAGSGVGSGSGQGPFDAPFGSGEGPRFVKKAPLKYPRLARELGREGTVLLRLTIDERGHLVTVEVVKPGGSGFDEEAVRAVKDSCFSPARRNGRPILCRAHLPIKFVLKNGEDN